MDKSITDNEIKRMGCDIARERDDSSVATVRQGSKVIWIEEWAKTDLMQTTGKILTLIEKFGIEHKNVNLDAVGVWAQACMID